MSTRRLLIGVWSIVALLTAGSAQDPSADIKDRKPKPSSCTKCHQKESGRLAEVVGEWEQSLHARMGIGCESCHGGDVKDETLAHSPEADFIARPRIRQVSYFCGKCHEAIKEKHLGSPHGAQGLPSCVGCHGSHAIPTPDPSKIIVEDACTKCHTFDSAQQSLESLLKARELVTKLAQQAKVLDHLPAARLHLEDRQKKLGLDREGVLSTFHSFRIGNIQTIGLNVDRMKKTIDRLLERETQRRETLARERPFIILLTVFLLLGTCLGYVVYYGKGKVEPGK